MCICEQKVSFEVFLGPATFKLSMCRSCLKPSVVGPKSTKDERDFHATLEKFMRSLAYGAHLLSTGLDFEGEPEQMAEGIPGGGDEHDKLLALLRHKIRNPRLEYSNRLYDKWATYAFENPEDWTPKKIVFFMPGMPGRPGFFGMHMSAAHLAPRVLTQESEDQGKLVDFVYLPVLKPADEVETETIR